MMKKMLFVMVILILTVIGCSKQTTLEKIEASKNNVQRSAKKLVNRIEEKVCAKDDLKCLELKVKNRAKEGTDYAKDKAKEAADKLD